MKGIFWRQLQSHPLTVLSVVWIIATLININKAFHMDDSFHLEVAQWIQQNPFNPMSGLINWSDSSQPIHHGNQPPLYFYLIAVIGSLFSYSELPLHLFQSIFTALCIIYFYKLVKIFNPAFALTATALLILNPAFLVNQNLMTDVPILSASIIFIYLLVNPAEEKQTRNIYLAAITLSVGILIKYSLLPLLVILAFKVLQSRKMSLVPALLLPIFILAIWTTFNYMEYGGSQLLDRPRNDINLRLLIQNSVSFLLTLGAIAPFTLIFIDSFIKSTRHYIIANVTIGVALCVLAVYFIVFGLPFRSPLYSLFWVAFFTNGLLLIIFAYIFLKRIACTPAIKLVVVWGVSLISFIVLFAPSMATRHTLLILPPLLIILGYAYQYTSIGTITFSIFITALLGILLGISDWQYANFYRSSAPVIFNQIPSSSKVWTAGHWGWQWYSKQVGMKFYDSDVSKLEVGDYFVIPQRVYKQNISSDIKLQRIHEIVYQHNIWNSITTAHFARFYHTYPMYIPWFVSLSPVDSIIIYKVIE
jgi:hypothetical protein